MVRVRFHAYIINVRSYYYLVVISNDTRLEAHSSKCAILRLAFIEAAKRQLAGTYLVFSENNYSSKNQRIRLQKKLDFLKFYILKASRAALHAWYLDKK